MEFPTCKYMRSLTIASLVLIAMFPSVTARAALIFRDDFSNPTLDPAWSIHSGVNSYSLTENPGNLRYDLTTATNPGDTNSVWIYRQFSGTEWVFDTKATYSIGPGSGRQLYIKMLLGDLTQRGVNEARWTRDRDSAGPRNSMIADLIDNSAVTENSIPPTLNDSVFVRIIRSGQNLTVQESDDGSVFTTLVMKDFNASLGATQTLLLSGAAFSSTSDYVDYDFVQVVATPEPTGLALASIGFMFLAAHRKRRRAHSQPIALTTP